MYGGYTNKEIIEFGDTVFEYESIKLHKIEIIPDTFKDELCYKVKLADIDENYQHIGYIPKDKIKEYKDLSDNFEPYDCSISILGGKYKEVVYDIEKDKDKIEICDDLSYGIEVTLYFK